MARMILLEQNIFPLAVVTVQTPLEAWSMVWTGDER